MITLTGGKYASAALSDVGTTTITTTTSPFVSGDFAVPRRVDLYNSAGTAFKGTAFVRSFVATNQLQLETQFFDPKTGATVTQVAGDTILVSKNWADVATTGIAVSGRNVTISNVIQFGTASSNSVAFHDEGVNVHNTLTSGAASLYDFYGGFVTFGHLQDYATKLFYNPCNFTYDYPTFNNAFISYAATARLCVWGGNHIGNGGAPLYYTSGYNGSTGIGTDWAYLLFMGVNLTNTDVMSKGLGASWADGTNEVLDNCTFTGAGSNQILVRFGNGTIIGGNFKVSNNSSLPISIFGSDAAGTYAIGAPADQRAIVLDIGNNNTLWRSGPNSTQTINITNVISTDYRAGYGLTPEGNPNTNATKNIYFKNSYTNLKDASTVATINDAAWTIDNSGTASGNGSSVAVQVFESTSIGNNVGTYRGDWTYRIRKFGYDEIEGSIAKSNYSLGTAGTAYDIGFGGSVLQIARGSIAVSQATALAYTGITVTDHGASPVTWNSKSWSITITVDLSVAPSRTAKEVFDHVKAGICSLSSWNGKTGILWHVLTEESGADYVTQRGKSGGAGASLKGVRVVDQSGNPFTGFVGMVADDGSTYVPPTTDTRGLQFTGLVAGSQVIVFNTGTTTELFNTASSSTTETWSQSASGSITVDYTVMKAGRRPVRVTGITVTGAVSGGVVATPIQQLDDRAYQASSGLVFGTTATVNAGTKRVTVTANTTVQNWYSFMIESWIAQSSLRNIEFPFSTNGPNSFTLGLGWEWGDGATSIAKLSRDGLRYVSTSGSVTATYAALLSIGTPAGTQVRYQQSDGGATVNAAATGNIDQLIQVYGDASHGNFDRTGHLVIKAQRDGYDEAAFDVFGTYGTLEDQLYVLGLQPISNGLTTGNPSLANPPTITDHGAAPVTWNAKQFSITITDSAAGNSGTSIMRWLRYNFGVGGTFQGKDGFNWHDLVQVNGTSFKTVRGAIYGDTGATLKGVRVLTNAGTAHPDFNLFTADDGTTYAPPLSISISNSNLASGSRVQLYNITKATELENITLASTGYSFNTLVGPSEAVSVGDVIRLRATYSSGTSYKTNYEESAVASTSNISFIGNAIAWTHANGLGINGSSQTDFATDYVNIEVDVSASGNTFSMGALIAWILYVQTTADGIRNFFGALSSRDAANWVINNSIVDLMLDNVNTATATQIDSVILMRADAVYPQVVPTSGGGGIGMIQSGLVFVTETGVSGLTTAESNALLAIPTNPLLTNDVRLNHLDADISSVGAGSAPSASENALAVRAELATELGRVDAPISSRLASAGYTAPSDTATLAAIAALNDISAADVLAAAVSTPITANVKKVNDITITGIGTDLNPWGPA